jgi:hypothetical protein
LEKPKQKSYPKVQPKRHLEDVLVILTSEVWENANPQETLKHRKQLPVMIQPGNSQLDLNSIWVEMLLHDQQSEYHSKQPFPSPLQVPNDSQISNENDILEKLKKPKRKSYPKVQPKRHLEDVLIILTNELWEKSNLKGH